MTQPFLQMINTRRSVRAYEDRPVEQSLIQSVVEAGRHAPSGGNCQYTHFLVITDREVLACLKDLVQQAFAAMEADEHTYKSLAHSINQSKKGSYDFIFNAPVLILTANRRGHGNAQADSAAAIENMLLASHALGLGACWINQLKWLTDHPTVRKYLCSLGLGAEEDIFGGLCIGWPAKQSGAPLPRKGNPVTWI